MTSHLESLKKHTRIVADTGDFKLIAEYKPMDSTTNPSLIKQACSLPQYKTLIDSAVNKERNSTSDEDKVVNNIIDRLTVLFGCEILKIIPGMVSTEVDAALSFDVEGMVQKSLKIIELYREYEIHSNRVYLKLPATWEGIQAAKVLKAEHKDIHVNMTLVFSLAQAVACADVGSDLISPFVGRITDFFKNVKKVQFDSIEQDPGVLSVVKIYNYYKKYGIPTIVMGASFRNTDQVRALCGVDALTISPQLLEQLSKIQGEVEPKLTPQKAMNENIERLKLDERQFRWLMNSDEMASVKLDEGIRNFHADTEILRQEIRKLLKS